MVEEQLKQQLNQQLKHIQADIDVLRENQEILFALNKKREEEINELRRALYQLEAELRAYLLSIAEMKKSTEGKEGEGGE